MVAIVRACHLEINAYLRIHGQLLWKGRPTAADDSMERGLGGSKGGGSETSWEAVVPIEVGMADGTGEGRKWLGMKPAIMSLQACVGDCSIRNLSTYKRADRSGV